jgi:hypothetical protein
MTTRRKPGFQGADSRTPAEAVLDANDTTLLDVLDKLLNKGVVLNGDVVMGVGGVDLVYLRLSSLLCAVDRVLPPTSKGKSSRQRHNRGPRPLRKP